MLRTRFEFHQLAIDLVLAIGALHVSFWLRTTVPLGRPMPPARLEAPAILPLIIVAVWVGIFMQNDIYVRTFGTRWWRQMFNLVKSHAIASLLFFGVLYLTYRDVSRLQSLYFVVVYLVLLLCSRVVGRAVEVRYIEADARKARVVIVGTGANAVRLRQKIEANPRHNLKFAGFFRLGDDEPVAGGIAETDILGTLDQLTPFVGQGGVGEVIIATSRFSQEVSSTISKLLYELQKFDVAVRLAPDYSDISFFRVVAENFEGLPLIGLRTPVFSPAQRLMKRWMDIVIATSLCMLGAPLFLLTALAIRLDSKGPVLLSQQRVGIHGRPFSMYKFRSMYDRVNQSDFDETTVNIIKRPDDPRVTRVGRFLRRSSLDELPQLINVIKGDMSLVGPRPELPARVQEYEWWQFKRFEVPQGMTGWWQINGRANRPMHLNTEDDLYYIEHYSLWMDIQILWYTLRVVLTGEGAF